MITINFRIKGEVIPIEERPIAPKEMGLFELIRTPINNVIQQPEKFNIDTQSNINVSFVPFRGITDELLLDYRLISDNKTKESFKKYKEFNGITFYNSGIAGDVIKEEYRDIIICYIAIRPTHPILIFRTFLHELVHVKFREIFEEWQRPLDNGSYFVNFRRYIRYSVKIVIGEYRAHYLSNLIILTNLMIDNKDQNIAIIKKDAFNILLSYIGKIPNEMELLATLDMENLDIGVSLIDYIREILIKIVNFVGVWNAFHKAKINSEEFSKVWERFLTSLMNTPIEQVVNDFFNLFIDVKEKIENIDEQFCISAFTEMFNKLKKN